MFWARSSDVESFVGRITQRITLDMTIGLTDVLEREVRNCGIGQDSERRLTAQGGIAADE